MKPLLKYDCPCPSNLILARSEDGPPRVKILDLGLALADVPCALESRELTSSGQVMGTFDYMAPEQATDSHEVDIRADIYSLGATLYKLLCGRPPVPGNRADSPVKRVMALVSTTPLPIHQLRSDLPKALAAVIDCMLARNPDQRYAVPAEVADALVPFCDGCDLGALLNKLVSAQPIARRNTLPPTTVRCEQGSSTGEAESEAPASEVSLAKTIVAWFPLRCAWQRRLILLGVVFGLLVVLTAAWLVRVEIEPAMSTLNRGDEVVVEIPDSAHHGAMGLTIPASGEAPPLAEAPFDPRQAEAHQHAWARHLGREVEITNSIGMRFRLIPPGEFMMGSFEYEPVYTTDQGPRHRVRITRPFYLGTFEVTQGEYTLVMGSNPSYYSSGGEHDKKGVGDFTGRHPVNAISWLGAVAFCNKLSQLEQLEPCYLIDGATVTAVKGHGYRLPTEAEWEYACRSGSEGMYSFADSTRLSDYAWYKANCEGLQPVGEKLPNGYGLYDVHGSLLEWCADWWAEDYYANSPVDDPPGPDTGEARVLRGGSWRNGHPPHLRCARRSRYAPDRSFDYSGFRVARSLSSEPSSRHPAQAGQDGLE